MKTFLFLIFSVVFVQAMVRVKLHHNHDQDKLQKLYNFLQKGQQDLMQPEQSENALTASMFVEKNHIRKGHHHKHHHHHPHHNHNHIATNSKIIQDDEQLMDVFPTKEDKFIKNLPEYALSPITQELDNQLEQRVNKQFLESETNIQKVNSFHANIDMTNVANTMFIGELGVGTEKGNNKFQVIFDTGSALTCISSELCHDIGCRKSKRYNREKSKTFKEIGKEVEITFGSGTLKGLINKEQLSVEDLKVEDAAFIEITKQIGEAFHDGDFDGLVGLAFPHMTGVPTLFDYLIDQHKLDSNEFTFHLNRQTGQSGSQLIFGGKDDSLIVGEWKYHKLMEKFYWSIPIHQISVGDTNTHVCSKAKPCKGVVDTGTTLLTGPSKDLRKLLSHIQVRPQCSNFKEMPPIHFKVDDETYTLEPEDYILTITKNGIDPPYTHSKQSDIVGCAGTLFPLDVQSPNGPLWILGDIFISKYSAAFDRETNSVGLGLSKFYVDQKQ